MTEFCITDTYKKLSSLKIPVKFIRDHGLSPGPIELIVKQNEDIEFRHTANLRADGMITKSAAIYRRYGLKTDMTLSIKPPSSGSQSLEISFKNKVINVQTSSEPRQNVFDKQNLKHIHFEVFAPENMDRWEPKNETDVFLAFGMLQEFTDYSYCCGMSEEVIKLLNYKVVGEKSSKPDAVIIEDSSGAYLVAEWKMFSKAFTSNHHKDEIDVLVVWEDDAKDKSALPNYVLELKSIARKAAVSVFSKSN